MSDILVIKEPVTEVITVGDSDVIVIKEQAIDIINAGTQGPEGIPGISAYEVAVAAGFVGTEQEWLDSLVGADGTFVGTMDDIVDGAIYVKTENNLTNALAANIHASGSDAETATSVAAIIDTTTAKTTLVDTDTFPLTEPTTLKKTLWSTIKSTLKTYFDGLYATITSLAGYIPYTGGTSNVNLGIHNLTVDTNSLFVDSVNHRVGIGTTAPYAPLDVYGSAKIGISNATSAVKTLDVAGDINFDVVDKPSAAELAAMTLTEDPNAAYNLVATKQYYYGVAYVTASGDTAARGDNLEKSITIGATNARVVITNIPISTDPRVTGRKIYRSQGIPGGNAYLGYRVVTINDNTTTTFTDNVADGSLVLTDGFYRKDNTTVKGIYVDGTLFAKMGTWNVSYGFNLLNNLAGGTENVAIGMNSTLVSVTTGSTNIGIGSSALNNITTGSSNIGLGYATLLGINTGVHNVGIGSNAIRLAGTIGSVTGNTGIGYAALLNIIAGNNYNTALGYYAGDGFQGSNNIFIGAKTGYMPAAGTIGNYNIFIGDDVGDNAANGANNNILIGKQLDLQITNGSNQLSIGNLILGTGLTSIGTTLSTGSIGIGILPTARLTLPAGTATANTAPLKFTSGTLNTTAETGAMEYNGANLTFTRSGTTREIVGTIVIKTDTGDGTGVEGLFQINTFDNTFKIYADGGWRTLATW